MKQHPRLSARLCTAALASLATLAMLTSCGGGGEGGISGTGVMALSITDAPACGFDAVHITIEKVRVNQDANASDTEPSGWSEVLLDPPLRIDLLTLTNGVTQPLGQTSLPAGRYSQMRLVLADNRATPLANAVTPTGGIETELTTPSAQQSGIKVNVSMDVAEGQRADFVIDFDACKSVVRRGNSGQFNLKPVINVIPLLSDAGARVVGYLDPALALPSTTVSLQQAGVPIKATAPDALGKFELFPVPQGSYDLVVSAQNRATAVMTGVPVVLSSITTVNSTSFPLLPAPSPQSTVMGRVTPTSATARALQTLTGGPTVEVAWAPVDADTGAFDAALPTQAPLRTAYLPNASAAYVFTADSAVAGLYSVEATLDQAVKSQAINLTLPSDAPIVFSFP